MAGSETSSDESPIVLSDSNISDYLGKIFLGKKIKDAWEVKGGLSHFTFTANLNGEVIYIKQSRDRLKGFPSIEQDPKRVKNEYNALLKINGIVGSGVVPNVVHFDQNNNILIISDVRDGGELLEDEFDKGNPHPETAESLGSFFAKLHSSSYGKDDSPQDRNINLDHRCLDVLSGADSSIKQLVASLVQESNKSKAAYITADICPKNVFTRPKEEKGVGVIDFEISHWGDPAFDVGFMAAHYVLRAENSLDDSTRKDFYACAKKILDSYLSGLTGPIVEDKKEIERRIMKFIGTTMLYRVDGLSKARYLKPEIIDKIRLKASGLIKNGSVISDLYDFD